MFDEIMKASPTVQNRILLTLRVLSTGEINQLGERLAEAKRLAASANYLGISYNKLDELELAATTGV